MQVSNPNIESPRDSTIWLFDKCWFNNDSDYVFLYIVTMIALYEDEKMNWWIRFWLQRCEPNLETSRGCTVRFFDKCWYNNELGYDFYIVLMIAPYEDEKMYC